MVFGLTDWGMKYESRKGTSGRGGLIQETGGYDETL
jgi:hypothetical protein